MRRALVALLVLIVLGATSFFALTLPTAWRILRGGDEAPIPAAQGNLENGRTLVFAGGCSSCHMVQGQDDRTRLGGGYALKSPFGTFHVPNISSHKQDGIGAWSPV